MRASTHRSLGPCLELWTEELVCAVGLRPLCTERCSPGLLERPSEAGEPSPPSVSIFLLDAPNQDHPVAYRPTPTRPNRTGPGELCELRRQLFLAATD